MNNTPGHVFLLILLIYFLYSQLAINENPGITNETVASVKISRYNEKLNGFWSLLWNEVFFGQSFRGLTNFHNPGACYNTSLITIKISFTSVSTQSKCRQLRRKKNRFKKLKIV